MFSWLDSFLSTRGICSVWKNLFVLAASDTWSYTRLILL